MRVALLALATSLTAAPMPASPFSASSVPAMHATGRIDAPVGPDYLDGIPDDLVLSIFSKLAASGTSPSDLLSVYLTCKRLNGLGQQDMVFAKASWRRS
ncbi:hypothetical protein ZWY2020_034578 [Hordeum vulgare]|nr:hypothetical protein ZWY2020_034578 [Hordeum vulgare]